MSAGQLAEKISGGDIVGVFNGASEFGPRALGGRSVLADPRDALVRERINRQIKHREPFRPLAPMILARYFDEYFWPATAKDYFMLTVAQANEQCVQRAPAVVHIDGGARVQVMDDDGDPFLVASARTIPRTYWRADCLEYLVQPKRRANRRNTD